MPGYHKYVFDTERRQLVVTLRQCTRRKTPKVSTAWFERDLVKELRKPISHTLLSQYNFVRILDVGCGKGTFTHLLKKRNNQ
jgi:2-polyprenyl-3-methyl-5-hydroxy-6-metoxy-1,4-benzoquinol methylase